MARSLGLTLYNFRARQQPRLAVERPPRPDGRLIWLHAPSTEMWGPMSELGRRLREEDGHIVLLTAPEGLARAGLICQAAPDDTQSDIQAFLDYWRPDALILSDGEMRPAALTEVLERKIPVALVNGRTPVLIRDRSGWWPGLMKGLLARVPEILVQDEAAARAFRKAGALAGAVKVAGRMEEGSAALPAVEADRQALAQGIGIRPVWFAAAVPDAEEAAVILAHRAAQGLAHRLLLIVAPQDQGRAKDLAHRMEAEEGWDVACRASEGEPDSDTEVYVVDNPAEFGLWYRLAPITYLGGSLSLAGCQRNPMEAAALGSAIIHGPRPGGYGTMFGRLGAALAARSVASSGDLAEALGDLLSPDRAARLAQAAWSVASDGAEVTDRVVGLVRWMMGEDG